MRRRGLEKVKHHVIELGFNSGLKTTIDVINLHRDKDNVYHWEAGKTEDEYMLSFNTDNVDYYKVIKEYHE